MSGDRAAGSAGDPPAFALFNEIGIIAQLSGTRFQRVMPHGLTLSQFTVLNHFVRLGGQRNLVELARAFQVTKGAMTNTVQRLNDKGFVSVEADPRDGRGKKVAITAAGRRARQDAIDALAPALAEVSAAFPAEELAAALPLLQRLRTWLDVHR